MSNKILTLRQKTIVDIADAIRNKIGSSELIKIEDLDDAIKSISGGNGGGIIEVDELQGPYLCTSVPNSGYVEKVRFDTSLSIEQVVAELEKLTYDEYGTYPLLINDNIMLLVMVNNGIYIIVDDEGGVLYFASAETEFCSAGWNSDFNGEIEINAEVMNSDVVGMIGAENDKIVNLFYLNKQPNPKFDAEAIHKLPDETLWIWSDNKFV
jgi:hypothetical protein